MGFNYITLLCLPLGLALPFALIIYLIIAGKKKPIAFDSFFMGFGAFLASIAAVAVASVLVNTFLLTRMAFSDDASVMSVAGIIISVIILVIYIVCESFKMSTIKKFQNADKPRALSSLGFTAGVVAAQNILVFVALNIFSRYEMNYGYAVFSGGILLFTGIMYGALSLASEVILAENYKAPAYAVSSVYYIFWLATIALVGTGTSEKISIILYIVSAFIFILSLVLSGIFIFKFKKSFKVN